MVCRLETRLVDNLWAGWRMSFLQSSESGAVEGEGDCVLCRLASGGKGDFDSNHYVLVRTSLCFVVLNAFPYAAGHLMIVPNVHQGDLTLLDSEVLVEAMQLCQRSISALQRVYDPEGFNFGANLGRAGGAAFGDHVHFHVVPRWLGDTNFMTTMANARVIPEGLSTTFERLKGLI